LTNEGTHG